MARLATQFVCVRIQAMNGQNVGLFQFDYDLTFMAFFMDAEDRIYARYGGREDDDPESHLSQASLVRTMRTVLETHERSQAQPGRHESAKRDVAMPESAAAIRAMLDRRKPGNRCIHCHDVKAAGIVERRAEGAFRKDLVFTYPTPSRIGLRVNRDDQQRVDEVVPDSPAARAGLQAGDRIMHVDGQRITTLGDFARVLELTPREAQLAIGYQRGGQLFKTTLSLAGDWRRSPDPSWRASTHWVGPNAGFWGVPLDAAEKRELGIAADGLAIRINFFFNNHPTPPKAGLQMRDVVIEIDGQRKAMTPRQLHAYLQMHHEFGARVPMTVRRGDREVKVTLELPAAPPPLE